GGCALGAVELGLVDAWGLDVGGLVGDQHWRRVVFGECLVVLDRGVAGFSSVAEVEEAGAFSGLAPEDASVQQRVVQFGCLGDLGVVSAPGARHRPDVGDSLVGVDQHSVLLGGQVFGGGDGLQRPGGQFVDL